MVAPALQKDGRYCIRKAPILDGELKNEETSDGNDKGGLQKKKEFVHD